MAAVPVILNGVFYPKGKSAGDQPMAGVMMGFLSIAGLSVGGGPIIPPEILPPNPDDPHPAHPIVLPPDLPPIVDPPPTNPAPNAVVVLKAAPETGGWGLAADPGTQKIQWFFAPAQGGIGPKK
jgi:hypothetical protein